MAEVSLPSIFGDHMVLQRDASLPIWGWADPGELVTVTLEGVAPVTTTATAQGEWRANLPPQRAGGPFTLTVKADNTISFQDVLIGEVWLCSGQSNMEWPVAASQNFEAEAAQADSYPLIRHIQVPKVPAGRPAEDLEGQWLVTSRDTVGGFTAVGYFFGRELHRDLQVPIGLINSSWGGTAIEPWIPPVGFARVDSLKDLSDRVQLADPTSQAHKQTLAAYLDQLRAWITQTERALAESIHPIAPPAFPEVLRPLDTHTTPTGLYNGMIAPLVPFAIRGAIWYQGESNHGEGMIYAEKMRALIEGWREVWGQPEMPFYYVQIAPFGYGDEDPTILPTFWEVQTAALSIPHTGMAVINDIADLDDIHPKNKQDVGRRLALLALRDTYGRTDLVAEGPTYRSMEVEGDSIRVAFDNVGSGLISRDGQPLSWFEIGNGEMGFVPANAVIDGDTVLVSAPGVTSPTAVRFAWHKLAVPNLANAEGLPARPFRAGELPAVDFLASHVPEASDYELIYDLDLNKLGPPPQYEIDAASRAAAFDRVAYILELRGSGGGPARFVYVSMDAFTDDASKLGIPTATTGTVFQQNVSNMTVVSNVEGIVQGENLPGGNIEIWPHNYGPFNAARVPGASDTVWDFGDQYSDPYDGYGCLQIHNHDAGQTLLAVNNLKAGPGADLGIGDSSDQNPDWTFAANASSYSYKRLRVLIRPRR